MRDIDDMETWFRDRMRPDVSFRQEVMRDELTCTISWNGVYMNVDATSLQRACAPSARPNMHALAEFADALFVKFCFALTEKFQENGKPKETGAIKVQPDPLMIEGEIV